VSKKDKGGGSAGPSGLEPTTTRRPSVFDERGSFRMRKEEGKAGVQRKG